MTGRKKKVERKGDGVMGKKGRKEQEAHVCLPFFFGKTGQFSGFVGKDKSKTYKEEKGDKWMAASILASFP